MRPSTSAINAIALHLFPFQCLPTPSTQSSTELSRPQGAKEFREKNVLDLRLSIVMDVANAELCRSSLRRTLVEVHYRSVHDFIAQFNEETVGASC